MKALRMVVEVVGELLVTAGFFVLAFLGWQLFWTDVTADRAQAKEVTVMQQEFGRANHDPNAKPVVLKDVPLGDAFALVRVPRWGSDYVRPVHEGTDSDTLGMGIGHYAESAMPGQLGNFATAGHRTSWGKPYADIDTLQKGDAIIVETATGFFVYSVYSHEVVLPTQTHVIAPVPDAPGSKPTQALMTLTSCNPKFSAATRWIVHAKLTGTYSRAEGPPSEVLAVPSGK